MSLVQPYTACCIDFLCSTHCLLDKQSKMSTLFQANTFSAIKRGSVVYCAETKRCAPHNACRGPQCHQAAVQQLLGTRQPGSPCLPSCGGRPGAQLHWPPQACPPLHQLACMRSTSLYPQPLQAESSRLIKYLMWRVFSISLDEQCQSLGLATTGEGGGCLG